MTETATFDFETLEAEIAEDPKEQYLLFSVKQLVLAVSISIVKGVEQVSRITPLPFKVPGIPGLIYFRGGIEACIDLSVILFSESFNKNDNSKVILIEHAGLRGGLLVDRLVSIQYIPPEKISDVNKNHFSAEVVNQQFQTETHQGVVLDTESLFHYLGTEIK